MPTTPTGWRQAGRTSCALSASGFATSASSRTASRPQRALSAPDEGEGATDLVALAERSVAPVERLAPELQSAGDALRQAGLQLRETASDLRAFLASLEAEPGRLEELEGELEGFSDLKRRYGAQTYAELLERGEEARRELDRLADGHDPVRAAADALDEAQAEVDRLHAELRAARQTAAAPFAAAVAAELRAIGLGDGEFQVVLSERDPGSSGADEVAFLIRPNAGLPFGPVAETASGGELSRVALAIAAVAGGETMVFDEIDAGIGGTTAHAVAETLRRLAERAQVRDDHPSPADRDRGRPSLLRREGPRRSDPHPHRAARRRPTARRARANARRG